MTLVLTIPQTVVHTNTLYPSDSISAASTTTTNTYFPESAFSVYQGNVDSSRIHQGSSQCNSVWLAANLDSATNLVPSLNPVSIRTKIACSGFIVSQYASTVPSPVDIWTDVINDEGDWGAA